MINSRLLTIASYLLVAFIIVFLFFTQYIQFNSDLVYLPSVFSDVFLRGHHFSSWYFTPAPYFFPDMLVFFAINTIISNVFYAFIVFAVLQAWVTLYLASRIAFFVTQQKRAIYLTHLVFLLALLFLTTQNEAFRNVLKTSCHFGTIINGLIFIYFLLAYITNPKNKYLCALFFISILSIGSDLLFIIQFMAPSIIALFFCKFLKKFNQVSIMKILFLSLFGGFIGFTVQYFLHIGNGKDYILVYKHGALSVFLKIFNDLFLTHAFIGSLIAIFYLALLARCAFDLFVKTEENMQWKTRNLSFFLSLFIFISLLCAFGNAIINDTSTMRYFLNLYWLPIIFFWLPFFSFLNNPLLNKSLFILLCFWVAVGVAYKAAFHMPYKTTYWPDYISCVDKHIAQYNRQNNEKIKYGISTYWQAKLTTVFSHEKITISQYDGNLNPRLWINTTENYRDRYDFAIVSQKNPLNSRLLEQLNGEPILKFQCSEDITLFIYGKNKLRVSA